MPINRVVVNASPLICLFKSGLADLRPPAAFASAQQELDDAVTWYNQQADSLGKDFIDERAFCNQVN